MPVNGKLTGQSNAIIFVFNVRFVEHFPNRIIYINGTCLNVPRAGNFQELSFTACNIFSWDFFASEKDLSSKISLITDDVIRLSKLGPNWPKEESLRNGTDKKNERKQNRLFMKNPETKNF